MLLSVSHGTRKNVDTNGVGLREACSAYERDKIEVAEWINIRDARTAETIRGFGCDTPASLVDEALLNTRVYRKHDRGCDGPMSLAPTMLAMRIDRRARPVRSRGHRGWW